MDMSSVNGFLSSGGTSWQGLVQSQKETQFETVLENATKNKDDAELKKSCVAFEAYFLQSMYKEMRKTVHDSDGFIPKGQAETLFQDMLEEQQCNQYADAGGIGLAQMMYRQMKKS